MNALQLLSAQPWVEHLGWTLLHFLWQGGLIAFVYAVTRHWITSNPNTRYLLACGALAAMAVVPFVTWNFTDPAGTALVSLIQSQAADVPGNTADAPANVNSSGTTVSTQLESRLLPWVVAVWFVGTIALWVRLIGSWVVAAGMRSRQVRAAPKDWQASLNALSARLRLTRPVRMLVSAVIQVPTVVGWFRPVVLMPVGALAGLPAEQVEALLLHELAHVRRHDYLVNIVQGIAETLLFYHPAVWWISGHIRAERELCCDDIAVSISGDALTYAQALADLESSRPAHALNAVAANGGVLTHRIARLLTPSQTVSRMRSTPGVVMSTVLSVATVLGIVLALMFALKADAQTPSNLQAGATMTQGIRAYNEARYDAAIEYCQEALRLDPKLTDAELCLGIAYSRRFVPGNPSPENQALAQKSIERFENALKKDPNNLTALVGLATVYQSADQVQKAREYYLRIEQLEPLNPIPFYSVGALDWIIAFDKRTPKTVEDKARIVDEGLQQVDVAIALYPDYYDAMTYKNLLLREKAQLTSDSVEKSRLIAEADDWFNKALGVRKKSVSASVPTPNSTPSPLNELAPPPPPPPPPPPKGAGAQDRAATSLGPVFKDGTPPRIRVSAAEFAGNLVTQVKPVYPEQAKQNNIRGVVILEVSVGKTGQVTDVNVIAGHPLLAAAAVEAVKQWVYKPTIFNGAPVDAIATVNINFASSQ